MVYVEVVMNTNEALNDFLFQDFYGYDITKKPEEWPEIAIWCENTFGPDNWQYYGGAFSFSKVGSAAMFILRWS
jgi:hypothetical protein